MENEKNYLEYLAELYPTIEKAATEIINLQSVINLPKGTEHFLSDIHGDLHLENVMLDQNNQLVLIDMMNVCKGTELYDVARTYFLLKYSLQGTTQGRYLTGGVPPVRFSM